MPRILVLDDDEMMLELTSAMLTAHGHDVISTLKPYDAFEAVRKHSFDLLILDIVMPDFSGVEFMNALKILNGFRTPILMLSGQSSVEAVKKSVELGAADYIVKPFGPEVLIPRVGAILGKRAGSTQLS